LMHYFVAQRTNEIGVRIAMGAVYSDVLGLVLRQGLLLACVGIVMGLGGAVGITRLISTLLYGVTPTDLVTFAGAAGILFGVAVLACWIPAHRAARIDPVVALRLD
jgi:putative ABC transport system permease protein